MNANRAEYLPHKGVMIEEFSSILKNVPAGYFIDATYGYGSHYRLNEQYEHLNFIGFDRDLESINNSHNDDKVYHLKFSQISKFLKDNELIPISGIFYDFGVSSHQIDKSSRGFSFQKDSDLDMRMDQLQDLTATEVVNDYSEDNLIAILKLYSQDKFSKKIGKAIVNSRPISGSQNLVEVIKDALPKQNPIYTKKTIRRIFQALRIEVNNELDEIKTSLESIKNLISKDGVIVCISYHSLEDKIVKNFIKEISIDCICEPIVPICKCNTRQEYKIPKKRKFVPTDKEKEINSRSKSAIMRYAIKI
ncbi:MAG: hypothetical protein CMD88_05835 [Gammaproteobacteria bacterium]|nr:hypothetical protein [Gammaproteobacteria bacterium]